LFQSCWDSSLAFHVRVSSYLLLEIVTRYPLRKVAILPHIANSKPRCSDNSQERANHLYAHLVHEIILASTPPANAAAAKDPPHSSFNLSLKWKMLGAAIDTYSPFFPNAATLNNLVKLLPKCGLGAYAAEGFQGLRRLHASGVVKCSGMLDHLPKAV
jgi:hypothetical protein